MNKVFSEILAAEAGAISSVNNRMVIYNDGLDGGYKPKKYILRFLNDFLPKWISEPLRSDMGNALRGFTDRMAVEICDDLIDCCSGYKLHVTGIQHVDDLLFNFYARILRCACEEGVELNNHLT